MKKKLNLDKNNRLKIDELNIFLTVKAIVIKLDVKQREMMFKQPLKSTPLDRENILYCPKNCDTYLYNFNNWFPLSKNDYVYEGFPVEGVIVDSNSMKKLNGDDDRLDFLAPTEIWWDRKEFVNYCLDNYQGFNETILKRFFNKCKSNDDIIRITKKADSLGRFRKTQVMPKRILIMEFEHNFYSNESENIYVERYANEVMRIQEYEKLGKGIYMAESIEHKSNIVKKPLVTCFAYNDKKIELTPKYFNSPYVIGPKIDNFREEF